MGAFPVKLSQFPGSFCTSGEIVLKYQLQRGNSLGKGKVLEKITENHPAHYPQLREAPCAHPATSKGWEMRREGEREILNISVSNILGGNTERKQKRPGNVIFVPSIPGAEPFSSEGTEDGFKHSQEHSGYSFRECLFRKTDPDTIFVPRQSQSKHPCCSFLPPGLFPSRSSRPVAFPWDYIKEKNKDLNNKKNSFSAIRGPKGWRIQGSIKG